MDLPETGPITEMHGEMSVAGKFRQLRNENAPIAITY
jgi:hypothetical protein